MKFSGMTRVSSSDPQVDPASVLCFMNVRDETLRLPYLLEYYRDLGVAHFFVLDNNSTDGTKELLEHQDDITLFSTDESFAANRCGLNWLEALRNRYGRNHWCLTVDADELFVFAHMDQIKLPELAAYLDARGEQAVLGLMIDCYPDGALRDADYVQGDPFADHAPFFDTTGYAFSYAASTGLVGAYGGARYRTFYNARAQTNRPQLRKIPFVKWVPGACYTSVNHAVSGVRFAEMTGAVLHYTFLENAVVMADRMVARGDRGINAVYGTLQTFLNDTPDATLMCDMSAKYSGPMQLFELGLLHCDTDFAGFVARKMRKTDPCQDSAAFFRNFKTAFRKRYQDRALNVRDAMDIWGKLSN